MENSRLIAKQKKFYTLFTPVCFIFSSIFLFFGLGYFIYIAQFILNSKSVMGEVTDFKSISGSNSNHKFSTLSPKIKYEVNGKIYDEFSDLSTTSGFNLALGEEVNILYNPDNPSKFMIDKPVDLLAIPTIFSVLGLFGILMGQFARKINKKQNL